MSYKHVNKYQCNQCVKVEYKEENTGIPENWFKLDLSINQIQGYCYQYDKHHFCSKTCLLAWIDETKEEIEMRGI